MSCRKNGISNEATWSFLYEAAFFRRCPLLLRRNYGTYHGGRLSRYYKGNFPKRPFSQRPYRGPWRGGTLADYHAWAAYQQTPTKAELRAEKRALKQAIKICSAHAQHIKSTAIANGPAATGWWEWSVNYENDPKFKGMKVIGGAYTNERPYCIANPHKGDMFITKQSYMYKRANIAGL